MKKSLISILVTLFLTNFVGIAQAADTGEGSITGITPIWNGAVLFNHSGTRDSIPACDIAPPQRWAIDASAANGQAQLSVLLSAYALHKHIVIHGSSSCTIWSDTETVAWFYVYD